MVMAGASFAALPVLLVFGALQQNIVCGVHAGGRQR
jgi:ABC-type glycerol-3-phosphate transport system permease component